jgi:Cytochrome b5-like Heme/Steroid binding domain
MRSSDGSVIYAQVSWVRVTTTPSSRFRFLPRSTHFIMSYSLSLSHPINTALLLYILYLLQRIIFPSTSVPRIPPSEFKAGYSWRPRSHAPALLFTTYTPRTLVKFDGQDGGRILLAIAGTVFDVTAGRGFYGPGKKIKKKLRLFLLLSAVVQKSS